MNWQNRWQKKSGCYYKRVAEKMKVTVSGRMEVGEEKKLKCFLLLHFKHIYWPPQFEAEQKKEVSGRKKKERNKREQESGRLAVGRREGVFNLKEQKPQCESKRERECGTPSLPPHPNTLVLDLLGCHNKMPLWQLRLDGLNNGHLFLTILETGKSKVKVPAR